MQTTVAPITRVRAMAGLAVVAVLVAGLALPGHAAHAAQTAARLGSVTTSATVRTAGALPSAVVPASTACTGTDPVTCELWGTPGTLNLPSTSVPIWGLATNGTDPGSTPGPVLVVTTGATVTLTVHNQLPDPLALAVPGVAMSGGNGDDTQGAPSGGVASYTFTAPDPGTYLYEAGHTSMGARQVAMGVVGALVVRPTGFDSNAPTLDGTTGTAFDDEAVLVLSEVDPALNAAPATYNLKNFRPTHRLINGQEFPNTSAIGTDHGRRALLRYVNAGVLGHSMGILGGKQQVLAVNGHATTDRPELVADMIAAGQTEDALVRFPTGGADRLPVYETAGTLDNAGQVVGTTRIVGFGGMLTFLQAGAGTPTGDTVGPTVSNVAVAPNPATPLAAATVTASASDVATGGSNIDQAEFYIDSTNVSPGTGTPMSGTFGSPTASLTGTITTTTLGALSQGTHTMYVRAHDSQGLWGTVSSATFKVGNTGPSAGSLSLTPNPVNSGSVALSATGDDSSIGGKVVAGEYFIGAAGANGTGAAVAVATPATIAAGTATIGAPTIAGLPAGAQTVYVHFLDDSNLWGPTSTVTLKIDRTAPALGASGNQVTPNPTDGTTGTPTDPTSLKVHATFVDPTVAGIASNVVAAEGFLDNGSGVSGTGIVFLADDGSWSSPSEAGYGLVPLSQLNGLVDGTHQVYVHAKDAAGNWGPLVGISFVLDRGPKTTASALGSLSVLAGPQTLATTTSVGTIVAAELFEGTDPGVGNGSSMVVFPTGPTSAQLIADPRSIGVGANQLVWVRAKDSNGIWGKAVGIPLTITGIFGDGFESGSTGAWSSATNATRLAVLKAAAMDGTWGLQVTAQGNNVAYVRRNFASTVSLHLGVKIDPQDFSSPASNAVVTVLQALSTNTQVLAVQLRNGTAGRQVRLVVGNGGSATLGTWTSLGTGVTEIRVDRTAAGLTTWSLNGIPVGAGVTNGTAGATNVRLGITTASGTTNANPTTGHVYLDSFGATN